MKFQQLRYVVEIVNQNFNVTEAANALFTSQPGISKQVRLLESELGLEIFERNGKHIKGLTPPGKRIVAISRELMMKMQGIYEAGSWDVTHRHNEYASTLYVAIGG